MKALPYPKLTLYIDGAWLPQAGGGERPVLNPADESLLGMLPLAGQTELDAALGSAAKGFGVWREVASIERQRIINAATALMRERAGAIAMALTLEQGKPLAQAEREVRLSAEIIDFLAEEGKRLYGRTVPARSADILAQEVRREGVGPVAAFTPWNFPVNLPARKLGGALAAGCSVIIKPDEFTPASCLEIVRCFHDAGLPPGVLNMVCGDPATVSEHLIASPLIRKVSFTGSVAVGKHLGELAARGMKRYTAELGGHAPVIVCADADIERAAKLSAIAKFRNAGQICTAPTRFLIERAAYASFRDAFVRETRALKVGSGLERGNEMGPLTHARRIAHVEQMIEDATNHGAGVLCGGKRLPGHGYFFAPTVIEKAAPDARIMHEEPFGPIAVLHPFDDLDQAITRANSLPYGLAAYAFTRELGRAHRLARALDAGMVGLNHFGVSQPELPFGGHKESGYGQESGLEGLLGYTDVKLVSFAA